MAQISASILDVDFLANLPQIDRPLVYLYRSGVLRLKVRNVFERVAAQRGESVVSCQPIELLQRLEGSFFPSSLCCDWSEAPFDEEDPLFEPTLRSVANRKIADCLLFVPDGSSVRKTEAWSRMAENVLTVVEPAPTAEASSATVRYLNQFDGWNISESILEDEDLLEGLDELQRRRGAGFFELRQLLVRHTVAMPRASKVLASKAGRASTPSGRLKSELIRFLGAPDELSQQKVIVALENVVRDGQSQSYVVAWLYEQTVHILRRSREKRDWKGFSIKLSWAGLLCARFDRLVRSAQESAYLRRTRASSFVTECDHLTRKLYTRVDGDDRRDPLTGHWAMLRGIAINDGADRNHDRRRKLFVEISECFEAYDGPRPSWFNKLADVVGSILKTSNEANGQSDQIGPREEINVYWRLNVLNEIVGHESAISDLRSILFQKAWEQPLLLHGVAGIGKRTIGRLIARSYLCSENQPGGEACGKCNDCSVFWRGHVGLIEFDVSNGLGSTSLRKFVADIRLYAMVPCRAIIIRNIDKAGEEESDVFLKILEEGLSGTLFILLASKLAEVRPAIRSRCAQFPLKPLSLDQASLLLGRMMTGRDLAIDKDSGDFIARISRGLPKEILRSLRRLEKCRTATIREVRESLTFDWGEDLISYWIGSLRKDDRHRADGYQTKIAGTVQSQARFRQLLNYICQYEGATGKPETYFHPALSYVDSALLDELVRELIALATGLNLSLYEVKRAFLDQALTSDCRSASDIISRTLESLERAAVKTSSFARMYV